MVQTLRSLEKKGGVSNNIGFNVSVGGGDGFDQIESGPLPTVSSSNSLAAPSVRPKAQTVIEKQVSFQLVP